jgi:hypothetical protein
VTRVWLPDPPEILGGLPEGMVADVWTGGEPLPESAAEVEVIVLPGGVSPDLMRKVFRLPTYATSLSSSPRRMKVGGISL